jgi:transposase-like protein
MDEYPMTFDEFVKQFPTEERCREYLYRLRWREGFSCPKCGGGSSWLVGGNLYECTDCGRQTSVIAGTIFQDTHKPLKTWFVAIWWLTTQKYGASAEGLSRVLGLSCETAWTWLHKIRTAMVFPNRSVLTGGAEVDETYVGGEEHGGKHGRGTSNKTLVAAAIEVAEKNKLGRLRMSVVPDMSKESSHKFVCDNVAPGSTVTSDGWSGYFGLSEKGYHHNVIVQKSAEDESEMLPHIHLIFSLLKRWLMGTHQGAVSEKHLQAYLDEFVFRFNRRKAAKRGLLFYRLLEGAMQTPPSTMNEIMHKSDEDC